MERVVLISYSHNGLAPRSFFMSSIVSTCHRCQLECMRNERGAQEDWSVLVVFVASVCLNL